MDELSLTDLEYLIEQIQESLDQVLQTRVIIASNTIEIYTLFEHIRVALIHAENCDPNLDIATNASENEPVGSMMETLVRLDREIEELITEYDEFI